MRCRKPERWISDDLDGSLRPGRRKALEAHLAGCPSCREYKRRLEALQAGVRELEGRRTMPDLAASLARLEGELRTAGREPFSRGERRAASGRQTRRWAWAGAATALAAAGILLVVTSGRTPEPGEEIPAGFEASLGAIYRDLASDPVLAGEFDEVIVASIGEHEIRPPEDVVPLLDGQALFLESLSDEEVRLLNEELLSEIVS